MHRIFGVRVLGAGQKEELREKQGHPAGGHPPRTLLLLLLILLILLTNAPPYFPSPAVLVRFPNPLDIGSQAGTLSRWGAF